MKRQFCAAMVLLFPVAAALAGGTVTVNKAGTGTYTTIMAAVNSGASTIIITDSSTYQEDVVIGDPTLFTIAAPVTLTSLSTGTNRPVITPVNGQTFVSTRASHNAAFGLFAPGSSLSNLVIEANPDIANSPDSALLVMATNVVINNCLFRVSFGSANSLNAAAAMVYFGQQEQNETGTGNPTIGGQDCNGCVMLNCEVTGLAPGASPVDPNTNSYGYLGQVSKGTGTGQGEGLVRNDHYSYPGENVLITFQDCYFHDTWDFGVFPSDFSPGPIGSINLVFNQCRFDANGKFNLRGRGANVFANSCVFTRAGQTHSSDTQDSAFSIEQNGACNARGAATNCLFVNCGGAAYQNAYFGGVNNDGSTNNLPVDHCTFVACNTGVDSSSGASTPSQGAVLVNSCIFHQIGDSVPPADDTFCITIFPGEETNVVTGASTGLYPSWYWGLQGPNTSLGSTFAAGPFHSTGKIWSGVFNHYNAPGAPITINNSMVGSIDTEDTTQTWTEALTNVIGAREFCGYPTNFVVNGVTRATPVFVNTDPNALNPFQLDPNSPGQGLGANLAAVLEPPLTFSRTAANQLTITWQLPVWVTNYTLASSSTLSSPTWTPVSTVTNASGLTYSATVPIGAGNQFYAIIPL